MKCAIILIFPIMLLASCSSMMMKDDQWVFNESGRSKIVRTAQRYVGVPYKRGGADPKGFDCSGYTTYVYHKHGKDLPRTAHEQYAAGKKIPRKALKPGDLVFFHTSAKKISHVGIYAGNNRFYHAPRTGKKVSLTDMKNPYWRKRYVGAVSYFGGGRRENGYLASRRP